MLRSKLLNHPFSIPAVGGLLFILWVAGCGVSKSSSDPTAPTTPPAGPQTYFAPSVSVDGAGLGMNTYTFDDKLATFSQTIFNNLQTSQPGSQVLNAGHFSASQRGLRSLSIYTTYIFNPSPPAYVPTDLTHLTNVVTSSFALELAGQAGGFAQLQLSGKDANGQELSIQQPVVPLVAATQCPNLSSAQTYQFVTIPGSLIPAGTGPIGAAWDPTTETAYGNVDISSNGSTVNFKNIQQFKLPSIGGKSTPAQPPSSSVTGICGPTNFGNTIVVPGQVVITNPGVPGSGNNTVSPQATIGIGSSGLLVEDNSGSGGGTLAGSSPLLPYDNVLGAGTGAVGLPKPSTALDTSAVVGAQYLGFIYAAGVYNGPHVSSGWSSHLASFGPSTVPSGCSPVATKTNTLIYGGDFINDNPSASSNGFGNSDFAIDLSSQDSANNGFYPHATVWVGACYAGNSTGATYSFPAVAIAGQLNGKYAVFLIGTDSTQPWAIYLLQSN